MDKRRACALCGASLVFRSSKFSDYLRCEAFPSCNYREVLKSYDVKTLKIIAASSCPDCHSSLAVKTGRYGMFIGCINYPDCEYHVTNAETRSAPTDFTCPQCNRRNVTVYLARKVMASGRVLFECPQHLCGFQSQQIPVMACCITCQSSSMKIEEGLVSCYLCSAN